MKLLKKIKCLLVLVSSSVVVPACNSCRSLHSFEDESPYEIVGYLEGGMHQTPTSIIRTQSIGVIVSIQANEYKSSKEKKSQQSSIKWRLTSWTLSCGLAGSLLGKNQKPITGDYELKEGENRLQLELKEITASHVIPTLTLTVEGTEMEKKILEIDLSEITLSRVKAEIADLEREIKVFSEQAKQAISQEQIDHTKQDQNHLLERIKGFKGMVEWCGDQKDLQHQLNKCERTILAAVESLVPIIEPHYEVLGYLERSINQRPISRTQPLSVIISIQTDADKSDRGKRNQQPTIKWEITSWTLSCGLAGSLLGKNGKPVIGNYELNKGENSLQLYLKDNTASGAIPTLTLTVEGTAMEKKILEIDLSEITLSRIKAEIADLEGKIKVFSEQAKQTKSQEQIDDTRYNQDKLLERIESLNGAIESCGGQEEMQHQLDKYEKTIRSSIKSPLLAIEPHYEVLGYLEEITNDKQINKNQPLSVILCIQSDAAKNNEKQAVQWKLTAWKLSCGIEGGLLGMNNEPVIGKNFELQEGKNKLYLALKNITEIGEEPTLTLTVEGVGVHQETLEIDLSEVTLNVAKEEIPALNREIKALSDRATQAISQEQINEIKYDRNRLRKKIEYLDETIYVCEGKKEDLVDQLIKSQKSLDDVVCKLPVDLEIQAKFGRGVNDFHPTERYTPLQEAIFHGDEEGVKLLLSHPDIEVNAYDSRTEDVENIFEKVHIYPPFVLLCLKLGNDDEGTYLDFDLGLNLLASLLQMGVKPAKGFQVIVPHEFITNYLPCDSKSWQLPYLPILCGGTATPTKDGKHYIIRHNIIKEQKEQLENSPYGKSYVIGYNPTQERSENIDSTQVDYSEQERSENIDSTQVDYSEQEGPENIDSTQVDYSENDCSRVDSSKWSRITSLLKRYIR